MHSSGLLTFSEATLRLGMHSEKSIPHVDAEAVPIDARLSSELTLRKVPRSLAAEIAGLRVARGE